MRETNPRPFPYIRWWLDGTPGSVGTIENGSMARGRLVLTPRRTRLTTRFYQVNFPRYTRPAGYRILYQNHDWRGEAAPGWWFRLPFLAFAPPDGRKGQKRRGGGGGG